MTTDERLAAIETNIARLAAAVERSNGLLIGWPAIERATGKKARTLRRYVRFGLPVIRWGGRVASSVQLISAWLTTVEAGRLNGTIPKYRARLRVVTQ